MPTVPLEETRKKTVGRLNDLRYMKRSIKLRAATDPESVDKIVENILHEAIAIRSVNEGRLGKGAVSELRDLRRSIIAGQVKAGRKSGEYITKISLILDELDKIDQEDADGLDSLTKNAGRSILAKLPSADTLIAGLITANPALGYTTKIAKDILSSRGTQKRDRKTERAARIAALEKEQAAAESQLEEVKDKENGHNASLDVLNSQKEELTKKLDEIRNELIKLNHLFNKNESAEESSLEKIEDSTEGTTQALEKLDATQQDQIKLEKVAASNASLKARENKLEGALPSSGSVTSTEAGGTGEKGNLLKEGLGKLTGKLGFLSGIGGAIGGGIGGIFGAVGRVFGSIGALFRGILAIGRVLIGATGYIAIVVTIVNGIKGFFEGFFNAGETLGLDKDAKTTFFQKLEAGFAGLLAGLYAPIDWVLSFFDLDSGKTETELRNTIGHFFTHFGDYWAKFVDYLASFFTLDNFKNNVIPGILGFYKKVYGFIFDMINDLSKALFGFDIEKYVTGLYDKVTDFFTGLMDTITQFFKGFVDKVKGWFGKTKSALDKAQESFIDSAHEFGHKYFGIQDEKDENTKKVQEASKHVPDKTATTMSVTSQDMAQMNAQAPRAQRSPTVIAPTSNTNISTNVLHRNSGAKNADSTYNRVNRRQQSYGY